MQMTRDELEYAISQYLDGTLMPLERDAVEERLATDADARAILAEYQQLNSALKAMPVPSIAWDRFAKEISQSLESEETPIRHYSLRSNMWVRGLAIAASILLVVSVAVHFVSNNPTSNPIKSSGSIAVAGPAIEQATGPAVAEISIGHSSTVADDWRAAEEVITRPSVVLIDQARPSAQDSDPVLY